MDDQIKKWADFIQEDPYGVLMSCEHCSQGVQKVLREFKINSLLI